MRIKILSICLLLLISSCSKEDLPETGCVTGIPVDGGERVLVRCCTKQEYLAGNNVAAGGVSYFANYTNHQYEAGKTCEQCQKKWW